MALYRVDETSGSLSEIPETSLSGEGKQERGDLQHWLRDHPDALEPDLFVLTEEYSDWADSGRRIDLLALDRDGRLVVIELKRDEGAFMDLQALRYAAMVANMTLARAVEAHDGYLRARGIKGDARERILEHLAGGEDAEPEIESSRPRILLAARDFPRELTTSVLWLRDSDIDIRCVRLLPYRVGDDLVLDVTQVIPLPEAEDYMVRVRDKTAEQERPSYARVPWTREDISLLADAVANNAAIVAALGLCADGPGKWIPLASIVEQSGRTQAQVQGELARLTVIVRRRFGRNNWPFVVESRLGADSTQRAHYRMSSEIAEWWREAREPSDESTEPVL